MSYSTVSTGMFCSVTLMSPVRSGTLSPQLRSKPIGDDVMAAAHILESFMLFRLNQYPGILSGKALLGGDVFSDFANRAIEARFSKAYSVEGKNETGNEGIERIIVVPCFVNKREFCAHIVLFKNGSAKIEAVRVRDGAYDEGFTGNTLGYAMKDLTGFSAPDHATVDITDKSVGAVVSFLEAVGADKLKDVFIGMVKGGKVFVTAGSVFISGEITVQMSVEENGRAASMLEQLLLMSNIGSLKFLRDGFLAAFSDHRAGGSVFDGNLFRQKYGLLLSVLETGIANEGGIDFSDGSYENVVELDSVDMSDCDAAGIPDDIAAVIAVVIYNEFRVHNRDRDNKVKIFPDQIPYEVSFKRLSDHVHPVIATGSLEGEDGEKGEIVVNENFVKMMYKLKGLRGATGDIMSLPEYEFEEGFDDRPFEFETAMDGVKVIKDRERIGNLYDSILYSVMLFAVRGGFRFENGVMVLNTGQEWAQGEKGRNHRYVNVLSMVFFWLAVIENQDIADEDHIRLFLKQHEQVTRGLTEEEIDMLPSHLLELVHDIFMRGSDVVIPGLPRVLMSDPTPGAVFKFLRYKMTPVTAENIAGAFRSCDEDMLAGSLRLLERSGVVRVADAKKTGDEPVKAYLPVPMTDRQADDMQSLLSENGNVSRDSDAATLRTAVLRVEDTRWANDFLRTAVDSRQTKEAIDAGNMMIIAIETDWVPAAQRDFIRGLMQEIGRIDDITVIRGSSGEIAEELKNTVDGVWTSWENVVVLAGEDAIKSVDFENIRKYHDVDGEALFVGVDAKNLKDDSYVRLMEMLALAVRARRGQPRLPEHPGLEVRKVDDRAYVFTPKAESLDLTFVKMIYDAQKKILSAAKDRGGHSRFVRPHFA